MPGSSVAVADAGPLIYLAVLGHYPFLRELLGTVLVPEAVYREVTGAPPGLPGSAETRAAVEQGWVQVRPLKDRGAISEPLEVLHAGEAKAIALALEQEADLLLLNDKLGRKTARERELRVTGTVGLLLAAQRRGLEVDLERDLDALVRAGFRRAPAVPAAVLREAGIKS